MPLFFPEKLRQVITARYREWQERPDPKDWRGAVRVDAQLHDHVRRSAKSGALTWRCDARPEVGGLGEAPGPLQYFVSGLPFCQMTHYAERATVLGLQLDGLDMQVRAHFTARPGGYFDEIVYETRIRSPAAPDRIRELVQLAERDCYVTSTLARAARITGQIFLNDTPLMTTHPGSS